MFIKTVISFLLAHIAILGGYNTRVYIAPPEARPSLIVATTTQPVSIIGVKKTIATSTKTVSQQATTTKEKIVIKATTTPVIPSQIVTIPSPEPAYDFESINTFARKAVVNILCTAKGGELSPISGTGIVVSGNGLILTNAHIGQYFLLKDFKQKDFIQCVARTGSPAYPKYNLELVYISPKWVETNKSILKQLNAKSNGENDFAFLRITEMVDGSTLPAEFPFVSMSISETMFTGDPVLLVSYPAGFLGGLSILQDLNVTSAVTNIQDLFTYTENTYDLIAFGGTVVSQKGSSGGMVVDRRGSLIGLISLSSNESSTENRTMYAITTPYINRSMQNELGKTLLQFASGDISLFANNFTQNTAPGLTQLITTELTTPR